jgi:nitrilase
MNRDRSFKVAAVQNSPVFLNQQGTVDLTARLTKEAANQGAKLVVFPEAFVAGYPDWVWVLPAGKKPAISEMFSALLASAVRVPSDTTEQIGEAAREAGVYLTIGINERNSEASDASLFNTLLYFGPDGSLLGKHRKLIPTGGERLMWSQGAADTMIALDSQLGKLGGLICWENLMPLPRQYMYEQGVQIYVAPTWDQSDQWQTAMRHIAREGGLFVISCCPCMSIDDIPDSYNYKKLYPSDREWINRGRSCIVGPDGNYLAEPLDSTKGILYAEVDLAKIPQFKWQFDVAGHYARPDVFRFELRD